MRMRLFRTRPAFLEREFRLNYRFENNADHGEADEHELEPEMHLPFNRRFQIELEPEYTWIDGKHGEPDRDGPTWTARAYLQLVDTECAAMNVQLGVTVPAGGELEEERTRLSVAVARFEDLGNQFGLQAHVGHDFLLGHSEPGEPDHELNYAVALTKTLTEETPGFEHFTVFVESFGITELNGEHEGRTQLSFVHGARWEVGKDWWVAAGVEVPVTGPRPYDEVFHFAVIKEID